MTDDTRDEQVLDADYSADDLADKLAGWLTCRPEKSSRQDVLTALHEWLKSQLPLVAGPVIDARFAALMASRDAADAAALAAHEAAYDEEQRKYRAGVAEAYGETPAATAPREPTWTQAEIDQVNAKAKEYDEMFAPPAAAPRDAVPRGHCNRCDRCGWTHAESRGGPLGGCVDGDCSQRPLPPYRLSCAGCGAVYKDGAPPAAAPSEDARWGVWCFEDRAWCQGSIGTKEQAQAWLPRWRSGEAADVNPANFHYEVRPVPPDYHENASPAPVERAEGPERVTLYWSDECLGLSTCATDTEEASFRIPVDYVRASDFDELAEAARALVESLPKCSNHPNLPATRAFERGGHRYCDECGRANAPARVATMRPELEVPEYPRAVPLRRIIALLDAARGKASR